MLRNAMRIASCLLAAMLLTASMTAIAFADDPVDEKTVETPVAEEQVNVDVPYFTSMKNVKTGLKINWGKVEGASGYMLYKKKGTGKYKLVKTTTATSFKDKKTTVGYIYRYYLVAFKNVDGQKVFSLASDEAYGVRVWFKKTSSKKSKSAQAKVIAKRIARSIGKKGKDIDRVNLAAWAVGCFSAQAKYTMNGSDYRTPYGVFVKGQYSCAGSTRALGMVLTQMGFKWKHVNENQYTHQWCSLKMDGKKGWADGMMGAAGYGS